MKEIWKDITGYEGLYQVSNMGNVKSYSKNKHGNNLKLSLQRDGYAMVHLYKDNIKKGLLVHRLVATEFIFNALNKEEVNHKNRIRNDNYYSNLEWVTKMENMDHATLHGSFKKLSNYDSPYSKNIIQYTLDGEYIKEYGSISDAYRKTKISIGLISLACHGKRNTACGYIWKFKTI